LSWGGVGLILISIWMSGSRGATLVLVVEGLLWVGILLWNRPQGVSARFLAVLAGVVLISAFIFSWLVSTGRVGGRAWTAFEANRSVEAKRGDRLRVGIDTLHMVRSHLLTGVGVGCFESVYPSYMTFSTDWHWTHAHDDVLEAAAETGIVGIVAILAALVLFFRTAFRHVAARLRHGWGWVQIGATVGALGLLCHSFVDFNLRVPANAAWFVVCLAVATHPRSAEKRSPRKKSWDSSMARNSEYLTQ